MIVVTVYTIWRRCGRLILKQVLTILISFQLMNKRIHTYNLYIHTYLTNDITHSEAARGPASCIKVNGDITAGNRFAFGRHRIHSILSLCAPLHSCM